MTGSAPQLAYKTGIGRELIRPAPNYRGVESGYEACRPVSAAVCRLTGCGAEPAVASAAPKPIELSYTHFTLPTA